MIENKTNNTNKPSNANTAILANTTISENTTISTKEYLTNMMKTYKDKRRRLRVLEIQLKDFKGVSVVVQWK